MAAVVGGSTGAALAAVVMIFEMTLNYTVIIPITITVALSYGVRTLLLPHSIYTLKLARRGHELPTALRANFVSLKRAKELMDTRFVVVPASATADDLARIASGRPDASCFLVEGPEGILGWLTTDQALRSSGKEGAGKVADLADSRLITVGKDTPLFDVVTRLRTAGASAALVTDDSGSVSGPRVRGLIAKQQIAEAMLAGTELFSD
jgi:CIC family chloride channel protein